MRKLVNAILAAAVLGGISAEAMGESHAAIRAPVVGRYELQLDGVAAGFVTGFVGGEAYSEVVTEKLGTDRVSKKHIAGVKYEDITIQTGMGMSKAYYQWIKDTIERRPNGRKNGAVQVLDQQDHELSKLAFTNAAITEIGFPALDASAKDAAKLTLKLSPEVTRRTAGGNAVVTQHEAAQKSKMWLPANFKLTFDDKTLDASKVNKIEALTIKQKVTENAVGDQRDYQRQTTSFEIPNLVITMAESHADAWYRWYEDFVIKGNCTDDKEKTATLEYLSPNLQTTYFGLKLKHVGVFRMSSEKVESSSENIRRVKVEMNVEDVGFDFSAAASP